MHDKWAAPPLASAMTRTGTKTKAGRLLSDTGPARPGMPNAGIVLMRGNNIQKYGGFANWRH